MSFVVAGSKIRLGFGFFAVVTLTMLLADTNIALVSLLSSCLHEVGHLIFLALFGEKPKSVEFGAFGIRITRQNINKLSNLKETVVLLAGPSVNLTLAFILHLLHKRTGSQILYAGVAVNLVLAIFNLLPFEVLDGGRALECLISNFASESLISKIMCATSYLTVAFLCVVGVYLYINVGFGLSFIAVTLYLVGILLISAFKRKFKG